MKPLAEIVAEHIADNLPDMDMNDGVYIGPPRLYDRASNNRNGVPPLSIFVNTSGGLMDQRYIGTDSGTQYKNVKIVVRSNKVSTANTGSSGNYQLGHKLVERLEMILRDFSNEYVTDVKLMSPAFYEGKGEDDMHYWFINARSMLCYSKNDIIYGITSNLDAQEEDIDLGSSTSSYMYHGDYEMVADNDSIFIAVPTSMTRGDNPLVSMYVDDNLSDDNPAESSLTAGDIDYLVYTYVGPYTGDIRFSLRQP